MFVLHCTGLAAIIVTLSFCSIDFSAAMSLITKTLNQSERFGLKARRSGLQRTSIGRAIVDSILLPSDIWKIFFGYKARFGAFPNIVAPTTFNECLQQFKLLSRRSKYTKWADKLLVRDYVTEKVGSKYLTNLLWSGNDLRTIDRKVLPQSFIVKANHGSGAVIIVNNKDTFDWDAAYQTTDRWLETDLSIEAAEWQYRWVPPRLLIEELLTGKNGQLPIDYKFFVFGGRVRLLEMHFDRFSNHTLVLVDRTFKRLDVPVSDIYPRFEGGLEKPDCFEEMIAVAEALSVGERFVRVDLYDIGRPVFGELTFTPDAGLGNDSPEFDRLLGRYYRGCTN
jgi:hypothetical protein